MDRQRQWRYLLPPVYTKAVVIDHGVDVFTVEAGHDEDLFEDGAIDSGFDFFRSMHLMAMCRPVVRWTPRQTVGKFQLLGC